MTKRLTELTKIRGKLLLGVVHLPPLPGSPGWTGDTIDHILNHAKRDAETLLGAGLDGYVVENFGDAPFYGDRVPPHVLTTMTRVAHELPRGDGLIGVNVLRNDALGALAVATALDLDFIRVNVHIGAMVTDQGLLEGRAYETLRERQRLASQVAIAADVGVKHAVPLGSGFDLSATAEETAYRGRADALIVTGSATGQAASLDHLRQVRAAVPDRPLWVGSGVRAETVAELLDIADGVIVGTALKHDGRVNEAVDEKRARALVRALRS